MNLKRPLGTGCGLWLILGLANAQETGLAWGGNPNCGSDKTTVQLSSEKIRIKIGPIYTHVTCAFVFKNSGPACKVNMEFPDQLFWPQPPSDSAGSGKLSGFQAFIDGRKATTTLVSDKEDETPINWHTRTVPFTSHQTRFILDQYRVRTGTAMATGNVPIHEVAYLMHTGGSWKGSIDKVNILVEFERGVVPNHLKVNSATNLHVKWATEYDKWDETNRNSVFYHGFAAPKVDHKRLEFVATNLSPSKRSDLYLYWRAGTTAVEAGPVSTKRVRTKKATHRYRPEESEQ